MRTTRTVDPGASSRRRFLEVLLARLSYANVTATLALFLALGGGAYAAVAPARKQRRRPADQAGRGHSLKGRW